MKKISVMRRKARIVADVEQRSVPASDSNYLGHLPTAIDLPPIYIVEIQVKTWWYWVTVWREACEFSDADARNHIDRGANRVYDVLTSCKGKEAQK